MDDFQIRLRQNLQSLRDHAYCAANSESSRQPEFAPNRFAAHAIASLEFGFRFRECFADFSNFSTGKLRCDQIGNSSLNLYPLLLRHGCDCFDYFLGGH